MEFARKTGSSGVLGYQLKSDIERLGIASFQLEILEVLETKPEMNDAQMRADLTALEQLWRRKYQRRSCISARRYRRTGVGAGVGLSHSGH